MKYLPLFLFIAACGDSNDSASTVSTINTNALIQTTIDQKTENYKKLCLDNNLAVIELDRQNCITANVSGINCSGESQVRVLHLNNIWEGIQARADAELRLCVATTPGADIFNDFCLATKDANLTSDCVYQCDAKTF